MKLHFLQHVWFEDLGNIKVWADKREITISRTAFFSKEQLPSINDFDWLVIMGGPMGVYDEAQYPWLVGEKKFIEEAIDANKTVLGVCLGAQLIADVLGTKVYKNKYKEIGWFNVSRVFGTNRSRAFSNLPNSFRAFHWHVDTFNLPKGAIRLAQSQACLNQAFEFNKKVIGLQFHLESTADSISRLIANCGEEVITGKFIQSTKRITGQNDNIEQANRLMDILLDNIFGSEN